MSDLTISMVPCATDTKTRDVGVEEVLNAIRTGGQRLRGQIEKIRDALRHGDENAKKQAGERKKQLPAVMWSGRFTQRKNEALVQHSGLLCADLDKLGGVLHGVREKLTGSPHVWTLFTSPSGEGLKAVFRVPADAQKHAGSFRAVEKHVRDLTGIQVDQACKDPARLCFMSYDPRLYINANAAPITPLPELEKSKATSKSDVNLSERQRIAVELLGDIDWQSETSGFVQCPGKHLHTTADGERDCKIDFDHVPTVHCFHDHCRGILDGINHELRSRIGKAEHVKPGETPQWQEPQPLPEDLPPVPAFDPLCLPDTLRPAVEDISERMQCSPEFPAVGMTVGLASLIGRKFGIRPKQYDDWLELCNLWGLEIAPVAMLKTPTLQQSLVPLHRLVAAAWDAFEKEEHEYAVSEMLRSQRKKLLEDDIRKDLKAKNESDAKGKVEKHLAAANEKPVCRRYEVNDTTIPKLGALLAQNPNGLLLVRDEIYGFWRDLDREDKAGDRAAYLEMWDGKGELTYDRIERGTIRVPSNTLSMLGTIQPDLVVAYVRDAVRGGRGNDGFIQRYQLAVWPDPPRDWKNVDRWPDSKAKKAAFALFEYLDELSAQDVGASVEEKEIPFLRFTPDAQECFNAWRASLEKRLLSGADHPAFRAHMAKYRKLVPALSLFCHVADRKLGAVSLKAIERALLWAECLEAHAQRIYSAALRSDMAAGRELAKHLQRRDLPERFNLREVYRKCWAGLGEKEDAEAAAEILCDLGWIRPALDAPRRVPGTPGRTPSPTFEVNPLVLEGAITPTDKTDTINSVSFAGGIPSHPQKIEGVSVGSVSDHEGVSEKSEASNSAGHPQSSEHPSTPTDKTDTIPEQKRVGWV